ncbi:ABC transporter ATP-binding protein [Actinomyces respiraculi]|uniref:ABC transporter ATP-binding protein n=1 Tax=Actinomyces respiraculi TaxID=2744574 RepID=UPI001422BC54|nr:ABC transporter ATP-binding protein [Actinomyces respiraculi]
MRDRCKADTSQTAYETSDTYNSVDTDPVGFVVAFKMMSPYWRSLALSLLIGVVAVAVGAVQPLVVSDIVDSFRDGIPRSQSIALVALLIGGAGLSAAREFIIERTGEKYAFDTRDRLIRHLYELPISCLDRRERGDLVTRVTTDVSETKNFLTSGFVDLAVSGLTVIVSLVMMAVIDGTLLLLSVVAVVLVLLVVLALGKRTRPVGLEMQNALGGLAEALSQALGSMRTIRATRATDREVDRANRCSSDVLRTGLLGARLRALLQTVSSVSIQILLIVVVGVGALRVTAGRLTTGELSAFIMYLMMMAAPVAMVGGIVASLGAAFGSLSRIIEIESEIAEQDIVRVVGQSEVRSPRNVIAFENVSFDYPNVRGGCSKSTSSALRGVTFSILQGETVAFVGPSGAGKSTLFSLIERFYDPSSGTIYFGGTDVLGLSRDQLRAHLSYVDQEAMVLPGSVRDNLRLGAPHASDEDCLSVLKQVNLVADVDSDSAVEYLELDVREQGKGLSGGERQRLAIARALLAGTSVLLLDEATSNLDGRNESMIQDAIAVPSNGHRTTLVIAHRLSTVISADRIIVMDRGQIVAQGSHRELMETSPLYRELAERQLLIDGSLATSVKPSIGHDVEVVGKSRLPACEVDRFGNGE